MPSSEQQSGLPMPEDRRFVVDNFPPPWTWRDLPPGLKAAFEDAERRLASLQAEVDQWRITTDKQRNRAWFDHHEAHGWPVGDDDYKERLTRRVCAMQEAPDGR